jgi:hypothetical protein
MAVYALEFWALEAGEGSEGGEECGRNGDVGPVLVMRPDIGMEG